MKKLILLILVSIFIYANETNNSFEDEFENEFAQNQIGEVFDPLSGYNRAMTSFNDVVYTNVLSPVASTYSNIVHEDIRSGLSNFFHNLAFPIRFINNLLQFKFQNSAEELGRFVVNTIWGLGGFMDVAKTELGWEEHNEDFGQTLGYWGVGEGFHIVLPFLGPSNLRDMISITADSYVSVLSTTGSSDLQYKIPQNFKEQLAIKLGDTINGTSLRLGQYETIKNDALDLYPFLRDAYSQNRKKLIEE